MSVGVGVAQSELWEMLPNTICKLLKNALIVINLWWSRDHEMLLVGMGVATIFSFVFGYLIVMSLNVGLTFQISRNLASPQLIGIFYQRALLINFMCCAFVITPLLYLSKRMLMDLGGVQQDLSKPVGDYLFQLVPSIYSFAFYDTTQCYLQAQKHRLAPLLVQVLAVFAHLFLIQEVGAAWSKNIVDFFAAISIYVYILLLPKRIPSWIEWTMRCFEGWSSHMKYLNLIALNTYLEALSMFFFALLAWGLSPEALICHICFLNLYQLLFLVFLGIKESILSRIAIRAKQGSADTRFLYKQGLLAVQQCLLAAILFVFLLFIYRQQILTFFILSSGARGEFLNNLPILSIAIIGDAVFAGISVLIKARNRNYSLLRLTVLVHTGAMGLAYYLGYTLQLGLGGLWYAWTTGILVNSIGVMLMLNARAKGGRDQTGNQTGRQEGIEMRRINS